MEAAVRSATGRVAWADCRRHGREWAACRRRGRWHGRRRDRRHVSWPRSMDSRWRPLPHDAPRRPWRWTMNSAARLEHRDVGARQGRGGGGAARALLLPGSALHQSGDHHRPATAREHHHSDGRLHHHLAHGDDGLHDARRAGQRHLEPQGLPGFLRRSRPARHADAGRPRLDPRRRLQLLRRPRRCQPGTASRTTGSRWWTTSPRRTSPSNPAASAASQFTLEAKRIGKFKLTLAAQHDRAGEARRHRGARDRSGPQRARAERRSSTAAWKLPCDTT